MRRVVAGVLAGFGLMGSQACSHGPRGNHTPYNTAHSTADVIAADGALCDLTRRLAGDAVRVHCLLEANDDPHQLQLTPEQTRRIREARLVLINGYDLTPALNHLPNTVKVAEIAVPNSPPLNSDRNSDHPTNHLTEPHDHGARDPHVWNDPRQAAAMAELVSERLQAIAPQAAAPIAQRTAAMQESLKALHSWNQRQFSTITAPRILASGHRAFASLARAYQLQELPVVDATSSSETLRPQSLSSAVNTLRHQGVRSLFSEQDPPSRTLERISRLSGVPVAPHPLLADHGGNNLMATLTDNTCRIVNGLGGHCDREGAEALRRRWNALSPPGGFSTSRRFSHGSADAG